MTELHDPEGMLTHLPLIMDDAQMAIDAVSPLTGRVDELRFDSPVTFVEVRNDSHRIDSKRWITARGRGILLGELCNLLRAASAQGCDVGWEVVRSRDVATTYSEENLYALVTQKAYTRDIAASLGSALVQDAWEPMHLCNAWRLRHMTRGAGAEFDYMTPARDAPASAPMERAWAFAARMACPTELRGTPTYWRWMLGLDPADINARTSNPIHCAYALARLTTLLTEVVANEQHTD